MLPPHRVWIIEAKSDKGMFSFQTVQLSRSVRMMANCLDAPAIAITHGSAVIVEVRSSI